MKDAAERGDPLPFTPRQGGASAGATATFAVTSVPSPLREGMASMAEATPKAEKKSEGGILRMVGL